MSIRLPVEAGWRDGSGVRGRSLTAGAAAGPTAADERGASPTFAEIPAALVAADGPTEALAWARLALAAVLGLRLALSPFASAVGQPDALWRPRGTGLLFASPPPVALVVALQVAGVVGAVVYVWRRRLPPLVVAWVCLLLLAGLRTSLGKILHNDVLLLIAAAPLLLAGSIPSKERAARHRPPGSSEELAARLRPPGSSEELAARHRPPGSSEEPKGSFSTGLVPLRSWLPATGRLAPLRSWLPATGLLAPLRSPVPARGLLAPLRARWSRKSAPGASATDEAARTALDAAAAIVLLSYFSAGWWKLLRSGPAWALSDNLRWSLAAGRGGSRWPALGEWLVANPAVCVALACGILGLELGAAALWLRPRLAPLFAAAAVLMHAGTWLVLGLDYWAHLATVALVLVPWARMRRR